MVAEYLLPDKKAVETHFMGIQIVSMAIEEFLLIIREIRLLSEMVISWKRYQR